MLRPLAHLWGRLGLRLRILLAFALLMTVTALVYAWAVLRVVEFTEEALMSRGMEREATRVEQVLSRGYKPEMQDGWTAYAMPGETSEGEAWRRSRVEPLPRACKEAPMGFSEIANRYAAFLYKRDVPGGTICLALDQTQFEAQEIWIMRFTWASVFVVLAISLVAGGLLAAAVLSPIERLSWAVRRQVGAQKYVPLAAEVSDDEVGQLARLCDCAMKELYEALDREKAFTGDVSHELRTPLTVVETSAELLSLSDLPERERRLVERIRTNARAMGEMIDLFLELARAEAPNFTTNRGAELGEIVEAVEALWGPRAQAKGLLLETYPAMVDAEGCPNPAVPLLSSGRRYPARHLTTVLGNLVKNAVRYTDRGMVLMVFSETGISVADTGPGLAPGEAERIFEPMMRGDAARGLTSVGVVNADAEGIRAEGLGLGLAIAMKIADRCGWRLRVVPSDAWYEAHPEAAARLREAAGGRVGAVFEIGLLEGAPVIRADRRTEII